MQIFVGNLPFGTDENELRKLFESFGEVISVNIRRDELTLQSRGTGFVHMKSESDGRLAVERLTGSIYKNYVLRINEARERSDEHLLPKDYKPHLARILECDIWDDEKSDIISAVFGLLEAKRSILNIILNQMKSEKISSSLRAAFGICLALLGDPREDVIDVDKLHFCYIPQGDFWRDIDYEEKLETSLDYNFWISQYPITNAQFNMFINDGGYSTKQFWDEAEQEQIWKDGYIISFGKRNQPVPFSEPYNLPNHPVVGINWYEALAFCRWLTNRWHQKNILPTEWIVHIPSEEEWEKVARGGVQIPAKPILKQISLENFESNALVELIRNPYPQRRYIWGDEFIPQKANIYGSGINTSNAVGAFPGDSSVYGCSEMCGNVLEWTRSIFDSYTYTSSDGIEKKHIGQTFKGGSSTESMYWALCSSRSRDLRNYRSRHRGFRLVLVPHKKLNLT